MVETRTRFNKIETEVRVENKAEFFEKKNSKEESEKRKQRAVECLQQGMSHTETVAVLKRELGVGVSPTTFARLRRSIQDTEQGKPAKGKSVKGKPAKGKYGVLVPAEVIRGTQRPRTLKDLVLNLQEVMREQDIRLVEITQSDAKITRVEVLRF